MLPQAFIDRHAAHMDVHPGLKVDQLQDLIPPSAEKGIRWMEQTGGEPLILNLDGIWTVVYAVAETPKARRSCCYDYESRIGRKRNPPETSALEQISPYPTMRLMSEEEYLSVQKVLPLDQKTSSWLLTPPDVRELGGAIFGDKRFGRVFIFHNTADCYYSSRAFRCVLPLAQV